MEVHRPGTESKSQLQTTPQLQQCQILKPTAPGEGSNLYLCRTQDATVRFLTHCTTAGTPRILFLIIALTLKIFFRWLFSFNAVLFTILLQIGMSKYTFGHSKLRYMHIVSSDLFASVDAEKGTGKKQKRIQVPIF